MFDLDVHLKVRFAVQIEGLSERMSVADLSRRVNLSKTACQVRMKRFAARGHILGYRAIIDHRRFGRPHVAFVEVKLSGWIIEGW
jgi:DNA-binding Lrp family transcriptional regulator